jgi:hypothetical protein
VEPVRTKIIFSPQNIICRKDREEICQTWKLKFLSTFVPLTWHNCAGNFGIQMLRLMKLKQLVCSGFATDMGTENEKAFHIFGLETLSHI